MEQLPSKKQKPQLQPLRQALYADAPVLITKAISRINLDKLEQQQEQRNRLENEIEYWRHRYRKEMRKPLGQRSDLDFIIRKGSELSNFLKALPQLPQLRALAEEDEQGVVDELQLLIIWLLDNLNISNSLTTNQIEGIAVLILEEYGAMRLEDVALVMRNAIKGAYGVIYNRLDAAIVLDWLNKHNANLQECRAQVQLNNHLRTKERNDALEIKDSAQKALALRLLYGKVNIDNSKKK
ncbi:MAG TPA: hypothetical protein PKD70_11200 [Saprospiraceae bacterium]|nr:hypothetical protein [Saprospiraceae bacterium]HMP14438.1 hypothetical protein [Saprospiraceae bacterium]